MNSAPDPQLQRALTALRALEPPSNGFESRLRGSLLRAAADPALFPRRAAAPARLGLVRPWRKRPLVALSLAALSLAGLAAAVTSATSRGWLWPRGELAGAPVLGAEPSRAPSSRAASPVQAPVPELPRALELPPASEPVPLPVPPQAERVSMPAPVRPRRNPPARDPGSRSTPAPPLHPPEQAGAPAPVPRFDLPDLPAHAAEPGSAPREQLSERPEHHLPDRDDQRRALDRIGDARDRAAERRRQVDRPRPILEAPPALERERRGPPEVREREREEREQPEPHESEGGRGRR